MFYIITYLRNLDDVDDGHGDVDVDGDVHVVDLVKTEWSNLLVVIVLENTLHFSMQIHLILDDLIYDNHWHLHKDKLAVIFIALINAV